MKNFFISKETKENQQELFNINKRNFVICDNWHDFAKNYNNKVDFIALPHQTKNGMWGVVYWRKGLNNISYYYSASTDTGEERKEVSALSKLYTSLDIDNLNNYYQSPKINTGNSINTSGSVEFSEAYANYVLKVLIRTECDLRSRSWAVPSVPVPVGAYQWWEYLGISKTDIEKYQTGEYQILKNDNDLNKLKKDKDKLNQTLPGLFTSSGEIDDNKLEEIKGLKTKTQILEERSRANNSNRSYAIRLKKGAEIVKSLEEFAKSRKIGFAEFSMIGSVEDVKVFFSLGGKEGHHQVKLPESSGVGKSSPGQMELLPSWGNITWDSNNPDEPIVHCHVNLADYEKLQVFGGHLKEAKVAITAEATLKVLSEEKVFKKLDNETNVPLWNFDEIESQKVIDDNQMLVAQIEVPPKSK